MALTSFFQCFKKQSKPVDLQKEQKKQAVAVAAATAAAADAAVAAAEAAIAVVRLTNQRRTDREIWAAVKIQSAFRAHLAKRALRALKALVKLQALVKGFLVRKQTARALKSMHALMRIQTRKSPLLEIQTPRSSQSTPKSTMSECNITPRRPRNYMVSTESSVAKLRCHSLPRHKRVTVSCERERERERMVVVRPRGSLSGVGKEAEVSLKSAILGRLNRCELSSEDEDRDYRHMRRW